MTPQCGSNRAISHFNAITKLTCEPRCPRDELQTENKFGPGIVATKFSKDANIRSILGPDIDCCYLAKTIYHFGWRGEENVEEKDVEIEDVEEALPTATRRNKFRRKTLIIRVRLGKNCSKFVLHKDMSCLREDRTLKN